MLESPDQRRAPAQPVSTSGKWLLAAIALLVPGGFLMVLGAQVFRGGAELDGLILLAMFAAGVPLTLIGVWFAWIHHRVRAEGATPRPHRIGVSTLAGAYAGALPWALAIVPAEPIGLLIVPVLAPWVAFQNGVAGIATMLLGGITGGAVAWWRTRDD